MIFSRRIYWTILIHILLILATSGIGLWLMISLKGTIIGMLFIVCALFQIGALTRKLNSFNLKIRLFLDAVQDKDNMLYFPEHHVSKEQELLNRSLNRINSLLAHSQTEYHKQEHFYRTLLEEVPNGIFVWDSSGKIILANSAALHLLNCPPLTQYRQIEPLLHNKANKERLSISQNQMKLQGETLTILSIKDIGTELSDKESESWSKLSHVLTHEIMNTIAPIISLSQTLSGYPDINEKTARGLHIIQSQSERLMEFTESFRHLSYLPQPDKKMFSLSDLLHNLEELLASDFKENRINFSFQCHPASIQIEGDSNQLSQVFLNLLKNSMQALENVENRSICMEVTRDEQLTIDIIDNGPGILPEIQEEIFIPFFSTKAEGTGIGLSLSKQIIRQHGGSLTIRESRPGKTIFRILLP